MADDKKLAKVDFQETSLDIWGSKYQLKDNEGNAVDKTIDDSYERIATALSKIERPEEQEKHKKNFIWALQNGAIPAGRITSNAGAERHKPSTSLINCTVSGTIPDSMDGIMKKQHEAALTLKAGCGAGYEFSTLRPKGAFVAGPGATTSGPLTFMDIYDAMCFTVASAGGRRGAQMGTFDVSHPDVMDFIKAKHKDGRLRQFNLSLLITDQFIEAVKNDGDWPLVFPISKNDVDLNKLDYEDSSQVVWREWPIHDKYVVNDEGLVACKVYKVIKAQNLWNMIMTSTYDYAEPGFILIDRVNAENNNWFCEDIRATNPCVTLDTWVQTENGPKQVSDLLNVASTVIVNGKKFDTTTEGFFETGSKDVYTLKTKEGFEVDLTDDHPVLKVISKTRFSKETEWCKAGELKAGDEIVLHNHSDFTNWNGNGSLEEGYLLGMLLGDGVIKEDKAIISVWKDKEVVNGSPQGVAPVMNLVENALNNMPHRSDFKGWQDISGRSESRISTRALKDLAESYGMVKGKKEVTEKLEKTSSEFHKGFLSGLFDADGSVQGTLEKGLSVRLAQSNINTLKAVQRMLARMGVISKIYEDRRSEGVAYLPNGNGENSEYKIKAQHELVISKSNIIAFAEKVGFVDSDKKARLLNNISGYKKGAQKEKFISKVFSFEYKGKETVYDVQVPGINAFDANGLYVHNCGEQPLPPYGACLLGSINLTQFVVNPFTENAYFDFERYKKVVSIFTRMLDNVVEINNLPLKKQREEIIRKRRHGMGFLGLGSTLTMLRMKYGSDESLEFTEEVSKVMALEGWRTGLELAKEKGPAPIMDEDFTVTGEMLRKRPEMVEDGYKEGDTVKGRVLHIKYSRYMQKVTKELTKKEVNEMLKVGLRFTHHTSIAPTGTISLSLANNASNGIEPSFSHHYLRNVIKEGQNSKAQVDVFSYELLAYRKFIDATAMPFDKEKPLPEYFTTSDDVTPEQHVKIQAAAQRWIDSSISKTANVPTEYPFEDFKDIYMTAYEEGLKGCTTFRFNPEVFSGVLVKESDLENTMYRFELKNGEVIEVKGNQKVEYEGQVHVAANLFDALKDGYYGKY